MENTRPVYIWEARAAEVFGANWQAKLGATERHQMHGHYWVHPSGGWSGHREMIPLTRGAADNIYHGCKSAEALESAIDKDCADAGFGVGMSREQYIEARLLMAIEIAETPGCDGWHDGGPRVWAQDGIEQECQSAILRASLEVGGRLHAANDTHTGVIDGLARLLSDRAPSPDYARRLAQDHAEFWALAHYFLESM